MDVANAAISGRSRRRDIVGPRQSITGAKAGLYGDWANGASRTGKQPADGYADAIPPTWRCAVFLSAALIASFVIAQPAPKFEIKDGDRIVWIGSTLVEREQRYGYWETALHAAFPDKQFTVRNLGWSGDTVFGEARGRFDFNNPDACFKQLVNLTLELKPTVIFVSYGTNESFEGEAGLPKFEKGLEKLLNALKPAKARVVLFTPLPFEIFKGGHALKKRNDQLSAYSSAIKRIANRRGLILADLEHC